MIHDIVRTVCVIAAMAAGCSLVIETRFQLVSLDLAHRQAVQPVASLHAPDPPPGRLRSFGRAVLDLADAGLGVVR